MQTYNVILKSEVSKTYLCKRAADSLDIDAEKKSVHSLSITADLKTDYNVGLIIGASGSGKTTLAKQIFGDDCFKIVLNEKLPILEQFPKNYTYDQCADLLSGVGLTQVPCWIRPVFTLSNGQKYRAEAALMMCSDEISIIDEWTSVVDRNVAKIMSFCIQKHARNQKKRVVLLSCHYDVIDWLNPDWIIDCNKESYQDRRLLWQKFKRSEQLKFDVRKTNSKSWKYFSKYHYLSDKLPGGENYFFGLFLNETQIGFICFSNYVPHSNKNLKKIFHFNRLVIHPDYSGIGLGIKFINETSKIMSELNYKIMGKFSSTPVYLSMIKNKNWKLKDIKRQIGKMNVGGNMMRKSGFRENIKTYSFEYIG